MIAATRKCGCLTNINVSSPAASPVSPYSPSKYSSPPYLPSTYNPSPFPSPSSPVCYSPPYPQPQNPPPNCSDPTFTQSSTCCSPPYPPPLSPEFSNLQAYYPCSPSTPTSNPLLFNPPALRPPFSNPPVPPFISKEDDDKCRCPRPGDPGYEGMGGACKPCCEGVIQYSPSKVTSEITGRGIPYKEIEVIINDNHIVIRMQKEPVADEWDPPCDCNGESPRSPGPGQEVGKQFGDNVVYQMANTANCQPVESSRKECDQQSSGCRTITVFPQLDKPQEDPDEEVHEEEFRKDKKVRNKKLEPRRLIDLEENPNIFLLRIRKRSDSGEKRNTVDLEFRAPRPWRPQPKPKPKPVEQPAPPAEDKGERAKKGRGGKRKKGKKGKK